MEFLSAGVASERRALAVVLIPFFLLALFYAVSVPIFEGPDEDDHFRYAKFIADHRALPVQLFQAGGGQAGHQGWQPPLYYALVALAIFPIDTRDFADHLWRNPNASYQGDPACCGRNLYYHSSGEDFPYTGTALAVHLGRLISILFGLVTLASLFLLAQKVLASIALSLAVTAIAAFNPSFLFASALVSNDISLAAFCTLTFLVLARILSRAGESNLRNVVLVASFVAGGILSKTTALGLVPFALGVLAFADWRAGRLHKFGPSQIALKFLVHALIFGTILVVLTGWYFARNQSLYGDPAALALINASAIFPRATPPTLYELFYINLPWLWQTFWGGPVPGDFSPVLLGTLTLLACLALLGLGVRTVRNLKRLGALFIFEPPFPILIVLVGWLVFIVVSQIQFIRISGGTDQGRYLFPAMASFAILFVVGLRQFHLLRTPLLYLLPLFLFSLALAVPFAYVLPAYARPPHQTKDLLLRADKTLNVNFANQIALRGYSLPARSVRRGDTLRVTFYWQALARMRESYRVFVHLVDERGRVAGGKDYVPVRGAYATVLWPPDDWVQDTASLVIASDAIAGTYQLEVGLYPFGKPDERLDRADADEDRVLLDAIEVVE